MKGNLSSNQASGEYYTVLSQLLNKTSNPKLGLERITNLLKAVGFDRNKMKIIQVVGTNGKGSTVAFIESILLSNGISCGLFTSPHLGSARERIRINGQMVSEADFVLAGNLVLKASGSLVEDASFFECVLAMAMVLFQKYRLKVAILEAGLGGRLDATSATKPDILGISMIDFDHQNILGPTIADIAWEKVGAAQSIKTVVSVKQVLEAEEVLRQASKKYSFNLVWAEECHKPLGLLGEHQKTNAGLALSLVENLKLKTTSPKTDQGLLAVNWPGRFEIIKGVKPIVLDGAHNPSGLFALINSLKSHTQFAHQSLIIIYGSLQGPNAQHKIKILLNGGLNIKYIFLHQSQNPRALPFADLLALMVSQGFNKHKLLAFSNWSDVENRALQEDACIVVCGSLYTVGEIRSRLLSIDMDPKSPSF